MDSHIWDSTWTFSSSSASRTADERPITPAPSTQIRFPLPPLEPLKAPAAAAELWDIVLRLPSAHMLLLAAALGCSPVLFVRLLRVCCGKAAAEWSCVQARWLSGLRGRAVDEQHAVEV